MNRKICFIGDANSIHIHRWIAPLVEKGCSITLVSYSPVHQHSYEYLAVDLTKITNLPKVRFFVWGLWLRSFLIHHKPDVLHAHQIQAAGWLGAISNYHPFIVSSWGSDLLIEPERSAFRRGLVKIVLNRCDRLIVSSNSLLSEATTFGVPANKIQMIPWGIETDIFRPIPKDRGQTRQQLGLDQDASLVLSPRGISPIYNIHRILVAFEHVRHRFPGSRLILIKFNVAQNYLASLENYIHKHEMQEEILWLEPQSSMEQMAKLYRAVDVTISIPRTEGYGFSVYEAIACGCPTIITDINAFESELSDQVHTIKIPIDDDGGALEIAITKLLSNPSLRKEISENSSSIIKAFSVNNRIEKSIALYDEVIGR